MTVKPHLTSEEYLQTQFLVNEFASGVGKELQSKLETRASNMRNWVSESCDYFVSQFCHIKETSELKKNSESVLVSKTSVNNPDILKIEQLNLTLTPVSIFLILLSLHFVCTDKENLFNNQSILGW